MYILPSRVHSDILLKPRKPHDRGGAVSRSFEFTRDNNLTASHDRFVPRLRNTLAAIEIPISPGRFSGRVHCLLPPHRSISSNTNGIAKYLQDRCSRTPTTTDVRTGDRFIFLTDAPWSFGTIRSRKDGQKLLSLFSRTSHKPHETRPRSDRVAVPRPPDPDRSVTPGRVSRSTGFVFYF